MYSLSSQEYSSACTRRIWRNLEDSGGVQAPAHAIDKVHLEYSRVFKDADLTYSSSIREHLQAEFKYDISDIFLVRIFQ